MYQRASAAPSTASAAPSREIVAALSAFEFPRAHFGNIFVTDLGN
jgi:hypothetical protein